MKELLRGPYNRVKMLGRILKFCYWSMLNVAYKFGLLSVSGIPVIINNFNRLTYPLKLINFLENCGVKNIIILDNNSTYQPLLEFYKNCGYKVIRERKNYGHLAFWKSGLYDKYKWNYFIYTDSDVVPVEECPPDFIAFFKSLLDKNLHLDKVGPGIKIDDLPESFSIKQKVIGYEKKYWRKEVQRGIYDAPIDTTLALYKPFSGLKAGEAYTLAAYRTGYPYLIRHLPWYTDSNDLSEEDNYYLRTSNDSSSIAKQGTEKNVY